MCRCNKALKPSSAKPRNVDRRLCRPSQPKLRLQPQRSLSTSAGVLVLTASQVQDARELRLANCNMIDHTCRQQEMRAASLRQSKLQFKRQKVQSHLETVKMNCGRCCSLSAPTPSFWKLFCCVVLKHGVLSAGYGQHDSCSGGGGCRHLQKG